MLGCTVAELNNRMTAAEYAEWQAFDALDPIGSYRGDIQLAMLMHWQLQLHSTTGANRLSVDELLLYKRYPTDVDPAAELAQQMAFFDSITQTK